MRKIKLTGSDEKHRRLMNESNSRLIPFPDGLTRLLTLRNWEWEVVDRLTKNKGWSARELPNAAFDHANEFCSDEAYFEEQLRRSFAAMVRVNMSYCMDLETPAANNKFLN